MTNSELFYPTLQVYIGEYVLNQGICIEFCSALKANSDWGRIHFTSEYQQSGMEVSVEDEVEVWLGYEDDIQCVFQGLVSKSYNAAEAGDVMQFQDYSRLLSKTYLNDTFQSCTPQEIITTGLGMAGIEEFKLSDEMFLPKTVSISHKNMLEVLKQINQLWQLDITYSFIAGVFCWGKGMEQSESYLFSYAENIISCSRESGFWVLETVCIPLLQAGCVISVDHPKVSGEYTIQKLRVKSDKCGFIRYFLYF